MTTQTAEKTPLTKKEKSYYIHSIVGLVIMFFFGFLPPFGPVTPLGMKFLGIFLGLIYLWSFVDMGWPILASFAALVILDCMPISGIYSAAFANPIVLMCLFTMLVLMPLSETGIFDYVAAWLLNLNFLKGHPWRLTIGLFVLVFVGCMLQGGLAVLFMVFELVYRICDMCGMKRSHPWAGAVVVGAVVTFVIGGALFPFSGMALFMMGIFAPLGGFAWPYLQYIAFMACMEVVIMGIYVLFMVIMRLDISPLKTVNVGDFVNELPPMTDYQKKATTLLISFIVCLILAGIAPNLPANPITGVLSRLGLVGMSWIFMCLMIIWRIKERGAFNLNIMASKVAWDSILIICVGMAFGPAITGEGTGISALLYQLTAPLLAGHSPFAFTLILCLITLVLTNFFNNTVVVMLMISIIAPYTATMDLNIITMAAMMLVASQMAMFLPGASYYAGLAHGQAQHIGRNSGFIFGGLIALATACAMPIMLVIGNMLF